MRLERWSLALAVASIFAFAASRFPADDPDLFWHLATAERVVRDGAFARIDAFSSTAAGAALTLHQWLGQLVLYGAYAIGSWWGIVGLRSLVVLALAAVVVHRALASGARPALAVLAALPGLALGRFVWGDRPELFGVVCLVAFVSLAIAAREGDPRALVVLPLLFALWSNLHGSFVVGVVLLAALLVEVWLFAPELRRAFTIAAAACAVATVAHPDGLAVYESPGWHFANPPRDIQEWGVPDVTTFPGALFATALLGALGAALLGRGAPTYWVVLLAPLAFLGLTALRHMPLFALAAAPYLAAALPDALARLRVVVRPDPRARVPSAVGFALAAVLMLAALVTAPREPDLSLYPVAGVAALRDERGVLLNEYDWGGYLIWFAREHPVFVDGRLRPYAGAVLDDYVAMLGLRPNWRAVLERREVGVVLVRPRRPLATRLREAGWEVLHENDVAVVLRRPRISSPDGGDAPAFAARADHILAPDAAGERPIR